MDREFLVIGVVVFILLITAWDAMHKISLGRIRRLEEEHKALAHKMEYWLEHQLGFEISFRMLSFVLLSVVSTALFSQVREYFPDHDFQFLIGNALLGIAIIIILSVIISRLLLKVDLLILRFAMPIMNILRCTVFAPIVYIARLTESGASKWTTQEGHEEKTSAEDEIMSLVEHDNEAGEESLEEDEKRMIKGIFDLDDTPVREIMTPRVDMTAAEISTSVADIKKLISESGHSRVPLYEKSVDSIKGVIYAKDFLDERLSGSKLEDYAHKALFIPETKNVGDLLAEFRANKIHVAIVIDEYGGTAGIVTLEDILEEIVGEIRDEYDYDEVEPISILQEDGSIITDGRTLLSDLNEEFELELPEDEDVDTIGGYVCGEFGKIPEENEEIANHKLGLIFKILKADRRKIISIKIYKNGDEPKG